MADEKLLSWPVKFREPGSVIRLNGMEVHSGNLTQETYEYLLGWSKDFAVQFAPLENQDGKPKVKSDGKAKESTGS